MHVCMFECLQCMCMCVWGGGGGYTCVRVCRHMGIISLKWNRNGWYFHFAAAAAVVVLIIAVIDY